jgi:hypothetical protein
LDNSLLSTLEEIIMDTKKDIMSELFATSLANSHASFDKDVVEEKELD